MLKVCVDDIPAFLKPSAAANATTELVRFLGEATFGTYLAQCSWVWHDKRPLGVACLD